MMSEQELKPCPFCGAPAEFHINHSLSHRKGETRGVARCTVVGCQGRFTTNYLDYEQAKQKWNTRQNDKARYVDAVKKLNPVRFVHNFPVVLLHEVIAAIEGVE
jgi:hypothetical protein